MACPHYIWWKCPSVYNILLTSVAQITPFTWQSVGDDISSHSDLDNIRCLDLKCTLVRLNSTELLGIHLIFPAFKIYGHTKSQLAKQFQPVILEPSQLASDSHFKFLRYNFQNWPHVHNVIWVQFHTVPNDIRKHCKPKYPGWKLLKTLPICFGI